MKFRSVVWDKEGFDVELSYADSNACPKGALEIIIGCMNRATGPVYLGTLALEVGYNLPRTAAMLDVLERCGAVHKLSEEELNVKNLRAGSNMYMLVNKRPS